MLTFSSVIVIFVLLMIAICKKELIKEDFTDEQKAELKKKFGSFIGDPYIREHQGMRSCYKTSDGKQVCRRRGALSNNPDATALIGEIIELPFPTTYKMDKQKYKIVSVMTGDPYFMGILSPEAPEQPDDLLRELSRPAGAAAAGAFAASKLGIFTAALSLGGGAQGTALAAVLGSTVAVTAIAAAVVVAIYYIYNRNKTNISHMDSGKYCGAAKSSNQALMNDKLITEMRLVLHFDSFKTWINDKKNNAQYDIIISKGKTSYKKLTTTTASKRPLLININEFEVINIDDVVYTPAAAAARPATASEKSNLMAIYKQYKTDIITKINKGKFAAAGLAAERYWSNPSALARKPEIPTQGNLYEKGVIDESSKFFLRLRSLDDIVNYILPKKYTQTGSFISPGFSETDSEWCRFKRIGEGGTAVENRRDCSSSATWLTTNNNSTKFTRSGKDVEACLNGLFEDDISDDDLKGNGRLQTQKVIKDMLLSEMAAVTAKLSGTIWDTSVGHTREVREDGMDSSRCYYHLYPRIGTWDNSLFVDSAGTLIKQAAARGCSTIPCLIKAAIADTPSPAYAGSTGGDRAPLEDAKKFCPNFRVLKGLDATLRKDIGKIPKLCKDYPYTCINDLGYDDDTTGPLRNLALETATKNIKMSAAEKKTKWILGSGKKINQNLFGEDTGGRLPDGTKSTAARSSKSKSKYEVKWSDQTVGDLHAQKHEITDFNDNYNNYIKEDGDGRKVLQKLYKPIYFYVTDFADYDAKIKNVLNSGGGLSAEQKTKLTNLSYIFPNKVVNNEPDYVPRRTITKSKAADANNNVKDSHLVYDATFPKRPTTQFCAPYIRQVDSWEKPALASSERSLDREDDHVFPRWAFEETIKKCLPGRAKGGNNTTVRKANKPLLTSQLNYIFGIYTYEKYNLEIISREHFISGNDLTDGLETDKIATSNFDISPEDLQIQIDKIRLRRLSKINKGYDENIACKFTKKTYDKATKATKAPNPLCTGTILKQCHYNVSTPVDVKGTKGEIVLYAVHNVVAKIKIKKDMIFINNKKTYKVLNVQQRACIDKDTYKYIITLTSPLHEDIDLKVEFKNELLKIDQEDIFHKMKNDNLGVIRGNDAELKWAKKMGFLKCYKDTVNNLDQDERNKYIPDINEVNPLIKNITEYAMKQDSDGACAALRTKMIVKDDRNINRNISITEKCKIIDKHAGLNDDINYTYEFKGLNESIIKKTYKHLHTLKNGRTSATAPPPIATVSLINTKYTVNGLGGITKKTQPKAVTGVGDGATQRILNSIHKKYPGKVLKFKDADLTIITNLLIYNLTLININSGGKYKYIITKKQWEKLPANNTGQGLYVALKASLAPLNAICSASFALSQQELQYCPGAAAYSKNCPKGNEYYYIKGNAAALVKDYEIIDIKVSEIGQKYNILVSTVQGIESKRGKPKNGWEKDFMFGASTQVGAETTLLTYFTSGLGGKQKPSYLKKFTNSGINNLLINKDKTCGDKTSTKKLICNNEKDIANLYKPTPVANTLAKYCFPKEEIESVLISSIPSDFNTEGEYYNWWKELNSKFQNKAIVDKILKYDDTNKGTKTYKKLYYREPTKQMNLDLNYVYDIANKMSPVEGGKLKKAYDECTDSIANYLP